MSKGGARFDFIVVGAGSAGCVVASRLAEAGYRVMLIEAGGRDSNPWIHIPLGFGRLIDEPRVNWRYETESEPGLGGRTLYCPRGKVLGGTSSINGLIYMRGPRGDFDHWNDLGNVGWRYEDVLPFFRRSEDQQRGADPFHGVGGPLRVSDWPGRHELAEAFVAAAREAGHPYNPDFNGSNFEGAGYYQLTARDGRRSSAATAFLRPLRRHPGLAVLTDSLVSRIVFSGRRATGVEFRKGTRIERAHADREVILAAGVFNSPQLLQISGIGPADWLRSLDIPLVNDLPGVGENLQDHFRISAVFECTKPITFNDVMNSRWRKVAMGLRYALRRTGPLASNEVPAGCFLRSRANAPTPDLQLTLALWSAPNLGRSRRLLDSFSGFTVGVINQRARSRGTVRIRSADPSQPPSIRLNFPSEPSDLEAMISGLQAVRRIVAQPSMAAYVKREVAPGSDCATHDQMIEFCRGTARTNMHAASTCKMGSDAMSVVDSRLRVHGVAGLRVVDGSIMPTLVAANPNAATIMIGEKGAAMIIKDARAMATLRPAES